MDRPKFGLVEIILGICSLFLAIILPIINLGDPEFVPLILLGFIFIVTGIFDFKRYYNRKFYIMIVTVILAIMVITTYISLQPISPVSNLSKYTFIIVIIFYIIGTLNVWTKTIKLPEFRKSLEYYDKSLAINPNDITLLNNKGVELTSRRRHKKALECFDKVLELDPEDAAALHNKSFLENHRKTLNIAQLFDGYPKLEVTEKAGKLFLEFKKINN